MDKIISQFGGSMRTETTQKRKRVSRATRQKQKIMIIGGAVIGLIAIIAIIAMILFLVLKTDYTDVETNTVFILEDGKIVSTDIEAFDEKTYDKEKLGDYVQKVIDTYNSENGEDMLKQNSYEVEENKATLVLEYANADVYEDVNGVELFTGTIAEAKKAGYDFNTNFAKMVDGKPVEVTAEEFMDGEDYKVVIIKSNTKVMLLDGEVCFVSTQNVSEVGEHSVLIKDGAALGTTDLDTEALGTEVDGSDGAIGEDELVVGEEEEIIFDFGDEPEEQGSQYSEVLTYIIYK